MERQWSPVGIIDSLFSLSSWTCLVLFWPTVYFLVVVVVVDVEGKEAKGANGVEYVDGFSLFEMEFLDQKSNHYIYHYYHYGTNTVQLRYNYGTTATILPAHPILNRVKVATEASARIPLLLFFASIFILPSYQTTPQREY